MSLPECHGLALRQKHSMTERTAAWDFFIDGQGKALSPSVLKSVQQEVDKELLHATDGEL